MKLLKGSGAALLALFLHWFTYYPSIAVYYGNQMKLDTLR